MDGLLESRWKMDPNKCLEEIRKLCASSDEEDFFSLVWRIAELDDWLSKGGFPPEAWRHAR